MSCSVGGSLGIYFLAVTVNPETLIVRIIIPENVSFQLIVRVSRAINSETVCKAKLDRRRRVESTLKWPSYSGLSRKTVGMIVESFGGDVFYPKISTNDP